MEPSFHLNSDLPDLTGVTRSSVHFREVILHNSVISHPFSVMFFS